MSWSSDHNGNRVPTGVGVEKKLNFADDAEVDTLLRAIKSLKTVNSLSYTKPTSLTTMAAAIEVDCVYPNRGVVVTELAHCGAYPTFSIDVVTSSGFNYQENPSWNGNNAIPPEGEINNPEYYEWEIILEFDINTNYKTLYILTIPFFLKNVQLDTFASPFELSRYATIFQLDSKSVKAFIYTIDDPASKILTFDVDVKGSLEVDGNTEYMNIPQYVGVTTIDDYSDSVTFSKNVGTGTDVTPPSIIYAPTTVYTNNGLECTLGFASTTIYKRSDNDLYYTSDGGSTLVNNLKYFSSNNSGSGDTNTASYYQNGEVCKTTVFACSDVDNLMACF